MNRFVSYYFIISVINVSVTTAVMFLARIFVIILTGIGHVVLTAVRLYWPS